MTAVFVALCGLAAALTVLLAAARRADVRHRDDERFSRHVRTRYGAGE